MTETFWTLLRDPAHWEFELFLMLVFDGLIVGLLWPFARLHWRHHISRDRRDEDARLKALVPQCPTVKYRWSIGVAPPRMMWYDRFGDVSTDLVGNEWTNMGKAPPA